MDNHLPDLIEPQGTPLVPSLRAALAVRRGQVEVFEHGVRSAVALAKEQIDCFAVADATRYSLNEELSLLEYGRGRAGNDQAALALVSRKLSALADRNDRRLTRRFG